MCRGAACCAPLGKLVAKIFLDFSRFHTILNGVDNYVWSAGACSRFSFSRPPFPPCRPRPTKIAPFRINQLGYAFFGTPLFCYSCIFMWGVPPTEEKMNTNSHSSTLLPLVRTGAEPGRCNHRFPNGKRCRLPGSDSQLGLCLRHFTMSAAAELSRKYAHDDAEDFSAELLGQPSELTSTVQVKQFLSRLLLLVTSGRISPRRAAVLVYITNQLHFSHTSPRR